MDMKYANRVMVSALVLGLMPAINILWELIHNRMPGWWRITEITGWPSFSLLQVIFGYWWVPGNAAGWPLSKHLFRWAIFLLLNVFLWGAMIFTGCEAMRRLRSRFSR